MDHQRGLGFSQGFFSHTFEHENKSCSACAKDPDRCAEGMAIGFGCVCVLCVCLNFFGIVIYTHKQQHLSIDMKTKIVQHVPRRRHKQRHRHSWFPAFVMLTFFQLIFYCFYSDMFSTCSPPYRRRSKTE